MSELNASVTDYIEVNKGLFLLKVKPDEGIPDFKAGQYVALGLPDENASGKLVKRAYSIGSSPNDKTALEFYIASVPDGALSPKLEKLRAGDRLFCAKKVVGTFTLDVVPEDKDLIFVATGTGLAPFMSMLRSGSIWSAERCIYLLHGVRYEGDLAYKQELSEIKSRYSNRFYYLPTVSRPTDSYKGVKGYVQQFFSPNDSSGKQVIETIICNTDKQHAFLCGNPAMVEEVSNLLKAQQFIEHSRKTPGNLHLENYW